MQLPTIRHRYEHMVFDSGRWQSFKPRPDDILICTSYKAGTTWTQMLCALLIFRTPEFGQPLTTMTPWLDLKATPIDELLAVYEAQTHRRFIKTHTPLDGLPYFPEATYLTVGRDPRDVFMSMLNHLQNGNPDAQERIFGVKADALPPMPEDVNEIFRMWLSTPSFEWEEDGFPYWSHFRHARTFWEYRQLPNVHLFHYSDYQADLPGEMRRLADALGIEIDDAEIAELGKAARFDAMKSRADELAPDVDHGMWRSNDAFFNSGTSGQWEGVLSDESLALYEQKKAAQPGMLGEWLEKGSRAAGNPRDL
ncbi:MAG TPA: sulfotransferase domain-containing protein [Pseudomonadales bacterium]